MATNKPWLDDLKGQKVWVGGLGGELGDRHAAWRSAPFRLGTPTAMLRDQSEALDLRQLMDQQTGGERREIQALKVMEHLDLFCKQAQALLVIASADLVDDHPP